MIAFLCAILKHKGSKIKAIIASELKIKDMFIDTWNRCGQELNCEASKCLADYENYHCTLHACSHQNITPGLKRFENFNLSQIPILLMSRTCLSN